MASGLPRSGSLVGSGSAVKIVAVVEHGSLLVRRMKSKVDGIGKDV